MLNDLKKKFEPEKKDPNIFDVILYGSLTRGKQEPSDIDIAVIFKQGTLKERLAKLQEMKRRISFEEKIDLKGILWEELFDESFFARSGLILEGISLLDELPISQKMDFESYSLFQYDFQGKTHTQKVKFNYLLKGRKTIGMIKKYEGHHLAPGIVQIPIRHSSIFEQILNTHYIHYSKKNILVQRPASF